MNRRAFISLLGSAAAWPLAGTAQQSPPTVGLLDGIAIRELDLTAFFKGLGEMGFVEGQNVFVDVRSAQGDPARLSELAADLVRRRVTVVATLGGPLPVLAVKAASTTMPIVFEMGGDPVELGMVASLNRPAGNATGVSILSPALEPKRLGLLHELLPNATRFAVLTNPSNQANSAAAESRIGELRRAAASIGAQIEVFRVGNISEIDSAFGALAQKHVDALLVTTSPFLAGRVAQLVTLAARYVMPAIYFDRRFPAAGGLMSYAASYSDQVRQVGVYVGRILKGEKPADLPVMLPTKFEFVINPQTAKLLGIEVPPTLLALADEVIE